ncbi:MAG TPA: SGNH/GDSL hydrolase family protein [Bryobacteraceae bacterium]|nr:SGNH/GDSL hydrolase family protein [Bryobacteraceae bacterium]
MMRYVAIVALLVMGAQAQAGSDGEPTREELERIALAQQRLLNDWAGLTRYGSENSELRLAPGEDRVVFIGDEVTEGWGQGQTKFFPGKPYFNRGISGQTTPQMLVRFRQDVISLKPKVVVIQGGANDLAGVAGPMTQGTAAEHLMSMVDLARANGIRVVIASLTPVCDCYRNVTARRPPGKIIGMNAWLKDFAEQSGAVYLNYYSALVEGRAFRKDLTADGVVPNEAGYNLMSALAEKAL